MSQLTITDKQELARVREEQAKRLKKKMEECEKGAFMMMMQTTRIASNEFSRQKVTLQERIDYCTLLKLRFDLQTSFEEARNRMMNSYSHDIAPCGLTITAVVRELTTIFVECKTREDYDKKAAAIYKDGGDTELRQRVDGMRQSCVAWWKRLHDMHEAFDAELPGVMPSVENLPGHGRAVTQIKILMALDRANWCLRMKMSIDDWYINGKSSMYTWIEEILEADNKWPAEFKC